MVCGLQCLQAAPVEDRLVTLRQEEIDAKQASVDELSARIVRLQKQYEQDQKNAAGTQEKIWKEYTESLETERKKLKEQILVLEERRNRFKEEFNRQVEASPVNTPEEEQKAWQNYSQGIEMERQKLQERTLLLDERRKRFEKELDKKRQEDQVLIREKENEIQRWMLERDRLKAELEQDRKNFEAHLKELKSRPDPVPTMDSRFRGNDNQGVIPAEAGIQNGSSQAAALGDSPQERGLAPFARRQRPEYYVEIGDVLDIDVWRVPDLSRSVPVRPDGRISMPVVGDLDVAGLSLVQVRELLTQKFAEYVWNPQVSISIRQFGGRKFIILGEIGGPGVYRFEHDISLLEAVALAGGFRENSRRGKIMIIRGDIRKQPQVKIISANMENVLKRGIISENITVLPNDIIYVGKDLIGDTKEILDNVVSPFFDTALDYFVLHSAARTDHNS